MSNFDAAALYKALADIKFNRISFQHEFDAAGNSTDFISYIGIHLTELSQVPELAIIIRMPNEALQAARQRVKQSQTSGSLLIWLIFTHKALVDIYSENGEVDVLTIEEVLDGGLVFPELFVPVKDLFPP